MEYRNLKTFDFNFTVPIVYNKYAFEKTIESLRSGFDILSNKDIDLIIESNEFMRRKTFLILFNKYPDFKLQYVMVFMAVITGSN
jgi:hypothetical protein